MPRSRTPRIPSARELRKVEADLALDKNGWLNANAANGVVDMRAGSLELGGGIDVFSDAGYALHSQSRIAGSQQMDRAWP